MYEGLGMIRSECISNLIVQVNSEVVVRSTNNCKIGSSIGWGITRKIKCLLSLNLNVRFMHIYKEANRCVSNMIWVVDANYLYFRSTPVEVYHVLVDDFLGVSLPHLTGGPTQRIFRPKWKFRWSLFKIIIVYFYRVI